MGNAKTPTSGMEVEVTAAEAFRHGVPAVVKPMYIPRRNVDGIAFIRAVAGLHKALPKQVHHAQELKLVYPYLPHTVLGDKWLRRIKLPKLQRVELVGVTVSPGALEKFIDHHPELCEVELVNAQLTVRGEEPAEEKEDSPCITFDGEWFGKIVSTLFYSV